MTTGDTQATAVARGERNALEMRAISKAFGGTWALDAVDLVVRAGEVHALVGHNGSGKSTLIKILAGYHVPDAGSIAIAGVPLELPMGAGDAQRQGSQFVHQDLGLVSSLSVTENLGLQQLGIRGQWHISWREKAREARAILRHHGIELDVNLTIAEVRPVERAMIAIIRAVEGLRHHGTASGVLVLDEPTVSLPVGDVEHLFALIREVARRGAGVLFVSHDLEEVYSIADRITVLRDGRRVATRVAEDVPHDELFELITGHQLAAPSTQGGSQPTDASGSALAVSDISGSGLHGVSFRVEPGEILGVTGLVGSGFEELPYLLFGAPAADDGSVRFGDAAVLANRLTPNLALELGAALIPANRLEHGSVPSMTVLDNLTMQVYKEYGRGLCLRRRPMMVDAEALLQEYDVRPPDPSMLYGALSGGNQQKVMMAKWLRWGPKVLLLHEPTQGVDVGAREEIIRLIRRAADGGASVLCASADHGDLARVCDRVLVLGRGTVMSQLSGTNLTDTRITAECYRSSDVATLETNR